MRRTILGLGLAAIVAYGTWFYAFGALIDTIADDTGWSVGFLASAFGTAQIVGAAAAIVGGRMLDRYGARTVLTLGGVAGGILLVLATSGGRWVFAGLFAAGGACIEATAFYHVTLSTAARADMARRVRMVTAVTILGALAGPIFLPLTARLAETIGWRPTVRTLGIVAIVGLVVAAQIVPSRSGRAATQQRLPALPAIRTALGDAAVRWKLAAAPLAAVGYMILLVYQVPVMVAAGVPLATAAAYGGARGLTQIAGRIGLVPIVERTGTGPAYAATLVLGAAGALSLFGAQHVAAAIAFVIMAGIAIGAASALDAVYGSEVYGSEDLGTLMGLQQLLAGVAGALAPIVSGVVFDATSSHTFTILLSTSGFVLAAGAIAATHRAMAAREAAGPTLRTDAEHRDPDRRR